MMRARSGVSLLLVLFGLAAGLDAYLAVRLRRAEAHAAALASAPTQAPASSAACETARAELQKCRAESWALFARAFEAERRSPPPPQAKEAPPPTAATPDQQRRALCDVAEDDLRRQWQGKREEVTKGLRRDLRDAQKQRAEAADEGTKLASAMGLDPAAQRAFLDAYTPLRQARIAAAADAVDADPPDYAALFEAARGLYADEDALAARLYGEDARQRLRASEIRGRTTILAIAATFADLPWDDSIAW
jgi:hypothetical protein